MATGHTFSQDPVTSDAVSGEVISNAANVPSGMSEAIKAKPEESDWQCEEEELACCGSDDVPSQMKDIIRARHEEFDKQEEAGSHMQTFSCANYYRIQTNQEIGLGEERVSVPVYFHDGLDESWISKLNAAIEAINEAAPGLYLHQGENESTSEITVQAHEVKKCFTRSKGKIISLDSKESNDRADIFLYNNLNEERKSGTALHELMHALGFKHEHKRSDGEKYLEYNLSKLDAAKKSQYQVSDDVTGISRFDPHSIMMYKLCEALKRKSDGDPVWNTKPGDERCQVLSELDKVGLNIMYRPVVHEQDEHDEGYNPHESSETGLMYCGRENCVQAGDGRCGPVKGANCPACRVLKTEKSEEIKGAGKWQGWTGLVYCGKRKPSSTPGPSDGDGICGPDQGEPCTECGKLIGYSDDSPEDQDEMH